VDGDFGGRDQAKAAEIRRLVRGGFGRRFGRGWLLCFVVVLCAVCFGG